MPMWLNLSPVNFVPLNSCMISLLGTINYRTTDMLHPLVHTMQVRMTALEEQCGQQPELYYIVIAMQEAFDRLDYPSTFCDLLF
ncbi:hypothetical protein PHLCEN_2v4159 [Hermanssonia centrifuga]|uniref:Uncharacterized protein n=1 Tax=Hermanssonia centrifuga TaxID=98765 RepID=A0A2R6PZ09_9APHY|nr:hypothetical protein PHLCEN_2v4159 [Hermanssonia centrifuga]